MPPIPERLTAALSDRYRLERELGAGGMATVYLAEAQRGDCKSAAALRREGLATGLVYNDYLYHWWNAVGKARSCKELPGLTAPRN